MGFDHVLVHSFIYAATINLYLFIMMVTSSPRVWGYTDYPQRIKDKVPPQTKREKTAAALYGIPWIIFTLGFPIWSTLQLESKFAEEQPFWMGFLNLLAMTLLASLIDLVVLDWLVVSRITPDFVIIPGTEKADYKDFSHHYTGHIRALGWIIVFSLLLAGIIWLL